MAPYARELLARLGSGGRQPVLIIDQSQATSVHRHEMLMVAVRIGNRALPLTWLVRKTAGALGFAEQAVLLERVAGWLPAGVRPVLMGDRFYGSPDLIALCADRGWSWRLRLKAGLLVFDRAGGETTLGEWLLLGLAIAMYWRSRPACGIAANTLSAPKKPWNERPKWCARSALSLFTRGLRRLTTCLISAIPPPPLWTAWATDSW